MINLNLQNFKNVICIGIGGGDVYYIAKLFLLLNVKVSGFDIQKSARTADLEKLGASIKYENPHSELEQCDFVIYSDSLPDKVIKDIIDSNPDKTFIEVGMFKNELIQKFEDKLLSEEVQNAFINSGIAPLYSFESENMKIIAVTGTDGKTSVVSMIYHMLTSLHKKCGMISTVMAKVGSEDIDTGLHVTSPSSQDLFKYLTLMKEKGCEFVVLETTSQGLFMGRLAGLKVDTAVYTNITQDHLGYHKTLENYANAKALLVTKHLKPEGNVILNVDDPKSFEVINQLTKNPSYYSIRDTQIDLPEVTRASDIQETSDGLDFLVEGKKYWLPVLGRYNISNALAAALSLKSFGINLHNSLETLTTFKPVEGRMNVLQTKPVTIIVDFAHTPNGLLNALKTAKKLVKEYNKLITVFGCAAKRDEYKRPIMGGYAKKYSDITILTAEDCRNEGLKVINDQIEKGWNDESNSLGR